MRMSNREGLINPGAKGIRLELAHPSHDLDGMSREQAGPLLSHHLKVVANHSEGSAHDTELVTLRLKISPFHGEIHSQPSSNALGL